ncbi:MAG: HAD family hydrolase [Planctomycetota bacterium]
MVQFGSDTVLDDSMRLVVFDCFDTLVCMRQRRYIARNGVRRLLNHLAKQRRELAILSDGSERGVRSALQQAGLGNRFPEIFAVERACELGADGIMRKRLDRVMAHFRRSPAETVFIGDSPIDAEAARSQGAHFIRVPGEADTDFSFAQLLDGASHYHSECYVDRLLRSYRQDRVDEDA